MMVDSIHPGVDKDIIIKNTGFELLWNKNLKATPEPTREELLILREKVDPLRYIIGKVIM